MYIRVYETERGYALRPQLSGPSYLTVTVKKEITLASYRKLIYSFKLGKIYARFEGKASFSVQTTEKSSKVELTLSKEAEVQINDLIFGAKGIFKVSGDKVEFGLGTDNFSITFNPFNLNPISIHLPSITLPVAGQKFSLEKELPKLNLKGTAEIEIEFIIDFIPDYLRLAKAVNPKNLKTLLQAGKSTLYKVGGKAKTVGRLAIKAGRAALIAPLKMIGNSIGRKLAMNALKLGSQTAALRKLVGSLGKLLGVAGILIETRLHVKAAIPGVLAHVNKKVLEAIIPTFANSYADFLALMTDEKAPLYDAFFDFSIKIKRVKEEPPNIYAVVEYLSQTGNVKDVNKHAGDWVADQLKMGSVRFTEEKVSLAETDWRILFREAYNLYFLFMDIALHSSNSTKRSSAWTFIRIAAKQIEDAGLIAAYQDVSTFVITSSLYQNNTSGGSPRDIWDEWKNVRTFHQIVFGKDFAARQAYYVSLIDPLNLTVRIPPFADYD